MKRLNLDEISNTICDHIVAENQATTEFVMEVKGFLLNLRPTLMDETQLEQSMALVVKCNEYLTEGEL